VLDHRRVLGPRQPVVAVASVLLEGEGAEQATMLRRRGERIGIGPINPHQLRYTFAHTWLAH
jgi:integrase